MLQLQIICRYIHDEHMTTCLNASDCKIDEGVTLKVKQSRKEGKTANGLSSNATHTNSR